MNDLTYKKHPQSKRLRMLFVKGAFVRPFIYARSLITMKAAKAT